MGGVYNQFVPEAGVIYPYGEKTVAMIGDKVHVLANGNTHVYSHNNIKITSVMSNLPVTDFNSVVVFYNKACDFNL